MRLADLFCCGGLAADGYAAVFGAGALTGYDISPQQNRMPITNCESRS